MIRIHFILSCLLFCTIINAQPTPLSFTHLGTGDEVILQKLNLQTTVFGNHATHTWTMIFKNTSGIAQEVNLTFPLPEKANITAYSIDINGKMRKAVPVEKHKATQVLEAIENRNVDPGLLERTDGNNFKTRIFPVSPNQTRTISIEYDEELSMNQGKLSLVLPFSYSKPVKEMHVDVRFVKATSKPVIDDKLNNFVEFYPQGNDFVASADLKEIVPSRPVTISIEQANESEQVMTEFYKGSNYFVVNKFTEGEKRIKASPTKIVILWDNSLSGLDRDIQKELSLLDAYISSLKNIDISLVFFNQSIDAIQQFQIRNGNWKNLKSELLKVTYDGGTQFGLLNLNRYQGDEYLLFSDGHQTYNKDSIKFNTRKPVYCIASSAKSDFSNLKYITYHTGGEIINLMNTNTVQALDMLRYESYKLLGVKKGSTVFDVYPSFPVSIQNSVSIAGKMIQAHDQITLQYGYGNKVIKEEIIHLEASRGNGHTRNTLNTARNAERASAFLNDPQTSKSVLRKPQLNIARLWAQKKLEELDLNYEQNKEEIEQTGKEFGLVTRNTSLLVLENASDYVRYEIDPPAELLAEYRQISKQERASMLSVKTDLLERTKSMNQTLLSWWNVKPKVVKRKGTSADSYTWANHAGTYAVSGTANAVTESDEVFDKVMNEEKSDGPSNTPPPFPNLRRVTSVNSHPVILKAEEVRNEEMPPPATSRNSNSTNQNLNLTLNYSSSNSQADTAYIEAPDAAALKQTMIGKEQMNETNFDKLNASVDDISGNNLAYLELIKQTAKDKQYQKYLELRPQYQSIPVFYYHIASYFLQTDRKTTGIKILSNLAELDFENYELYKMLGYKLRQIDEREAAVSVFKKVLDWRPDEPQSYRDYALALSDAGQYQRALAYFNMALNHSYDENKNLAYEGIEEILLMEIKQLISGHGTSLNKKDIPVLLQRNLPVDVRVVLNWNMIDTDIDLWVTDPSKECCKYDHAETKMRGRISNDFTDGLGPEQFILRNAKKGRYVIQADFYGQTQVKIAGSTTVFAEVYTHYGTPQQTRKLITFQLQEGEDRTRMIGEFVL